MYFWLTVLYIYSSDAHPAIEDNQRMLPLHHAVIGNHKECIRLLVSHPKGLTGLKLALSLAMSNSRADIVSILKEAMLKYVRCYYKFVDCHLININVDDRKK